MKYWSNFIYFNQENAFEDVVCEMAAILSRPQWVNLTGCLLMQDWGLTSAGHLNSLAPGRCGNDCVISNSLHRMVAWALAVKFPNRWMPQNHSRVSIGSGNDLVLSGHKPLSKPILPLYVYHHLVSLGHNELTHWGLETPFCIMELDKLWFK